jgi:hypothetical protein
MGWQLMQVVLQYACWKLDLSNMDSSLIVCGFVVHLLDCLNGWMLRVAPKVSKSHYGDRLLVNGI